VILNSGSFRAQATNQGEKKTLLSLKAGLAGVDSLFEALQTKYSGFRAVSWD
jgi:hypothetical protein